MDVTIVHLVDDWHLYFEILFILTDTCQLLPVERISIDEVFLLLISLFVLGHTPLKLRVSVLYNHCGVPTDQKHWQEAVLCCFFGVTVPD